MEKFLWMFMIIVSVFGCHSKNSSQTNSHPVPPTDYQVQASLDATLTTFSIVSTTLSSMTLVAVEPQYGQQRQDGQLVANVAKISVVFTAVDTATSGALKCQVLIPLVTDPATKPMPAASTAACVPS